MGPRRPSPSRSPPGKPAPRGRGAGWRASLTEQQTRGRPPDSPAPPKSCRASGQDPADRMSPTYSSRPRRLLRRGLHRNGHSLKAAGRLHVPTCTAPRAGAIRGPHSRAYARYAGAVGRSAPDCWGLRRGQGSRLARLETVLRNPARSRCDLTGAGGGRRPQDWASRFLWLLPAAVCD